MLSVISCSLLTSSGNDDKLQLNVIHIHSPSTLLGTHVDMLIREVIQSANHEAAVKEIESFGYKQNSLWFGDKSFFKEEMV